MGLPPISFERALGIVANKPEEIATALREWAKQKSAQGHIPPLPPSAGAGLSRQAQAERLQSILLRVTQPADVLTD